MHMLLFAILSILNLGPLHEAGYKGAGKTIAVIDGGFYRVDSLPDIFPPERIVGYKDFLNDSSTFLVSPTEGHGAMVLSTMLTEYDKDGAPFGTAPEASYYLIRTEDSQKEYPEEMDYLAEGIRYADSIGADIITISLGYRLFDGGFGDLTYEDLNGKSKVSQAATMAARHGKLVCVAAGNDGNNDWHFISVPSDADSILTVGAVSADSIAGGFSSYGPAADGRKKPEVSAWGVACPVYNSYAEDFTISNGTSFATPRIAGMAACIWQALPQLTAMQLRQLIIESASDYPNWHEQAGYGIPNAGMIVSRANGLTETGTSEEEEPVYYNLQGIRLDYVPEHGFYIEKRGAKAKKILRP